MDHNKDNVTRIIFEAINEVNQLRPADQKLAESFDTPLFGQVKNLDSLGLVNLMVSIEDKVDEELDVTISLGDEGTMSEDDNPFETIGSLVDYVSTLVG